MLRAISPKMLLETKGLKDIVKIHNEKGGDRKEERKTKDTTLVDGWGSPRGGTGKTHMVGQSWGRSWLKDHPVTVASEGAIIKKFFLSHPSSETHCFSYSQIFPVLPEVHTENYSWHPHSHRFTHFDLVPLFWVYLFLSLIHLKFWLKKKLPVPQTHAIFSHLSVSAYYWLYL